MFPTKPRTPNPFYYQGDYQHSHQWRPNMRPDMHYQKTNNVHHYVTSNLEYERHWCETCDRGFPSLEFLQKHKQQHQKCNIDGCQFIAHPKVITKHIQMQHSTGLYKRIAKLDNPEEIQKWIDERKKKYPTKLNIDKKLAQVKEKIERGEKMGLQRKEHRKFNSAVSGISSKRKHNFNNDQSYKKNKHFDKSKSQCNANAAKKQPEPRERHNNNNILQDDSRKLKPFAGIQKMDMENDKEENLEQTDDVFLLIDDDFEETSEVNVVLPNLQEPSVCSALSALMCNYESSEEETEENKEYKPNCENTTDSSKEIEMESKSHDLFTTGKLVDQKSVVDNKSDNMKNVNEIKRFQDSEYSSKVKPIVVGEQRLHEVPAMVQSAMKPNEDDKSDNDSGPEEVKVVKSTDLNTNITKNQSNHNKDIPASMRKRPTNNNNFRRQAFKKPKPKLPSTLLHKLLHREMQHERNIVLQCVRHIVKNNYFKK